MEIVYNSLNMSQENEIVSWLSNHSHVLMNHFDKAYRFLQSNWFFLGSTVSAKRSLGNPRVLLSD